MFLADLVPSPFTAFSESSSLMFSLSRIPREGARQVPSRGFLPPVLVLLSAFGLVSREAPSFEPTSRHISPKSVPLGYHDMKRWVKARVNNKSPSELPNNNFFAVPEQPLSQDGHEETSAS